MFSEYQMPLWRLLREMEWVTEMMGALGLVLLAVVITAYWWERR